MLEGGGRTAGSGELREREEECGHCKGDKGGKQSVMRRVRLTDCTRGVSKRCETEVGVLGAHQKGMKNKSAPSACRSPKDWSLKQAGRLGTRWRGGATLGGRGLTRIHGGGC